MAIVCGGRDYDDAHRLYAELDDLSPTMIIHGGADGADSLAGKWAARRKVPSMCWPADWPTHGKAAGFIRNRQMAEFLGIMRLLGNQTLVVAFPGGRGTAHMVETAESMEFKVWQIDDE